MGDFRGFVHGLVRDARRILQEDLLFRNQQGAAPIPAVPWLSMRDDPSQAATGWSGDNLHALDLRLLGTSEVSGHLKQVVQFREKLSVLVHTTEGQPARAPELLSIRIHNTPNGGHRNVFVEGHKIPKKRNDTKN
ncbi:hypothetical protein V8E54_000878 [Elaphomyces granulatus]